MGGIRVVRFIIALVALALNPLPAPAQDQTVEELRRIAVEQANQIASQQMQIDALRHSIEESKSLLDRAMSLVPGSVPQAAGPPSGRPGTTAAAAATPSGPASPGRALPSPDAGQGLPLNASQEVRFSNSSPTLKLGPADIRLQGYVALTSLFDTANVGGSIGTNFAAIPFSDTPEGNASEFRLSSQRTRVAVRVDTQLGQGDLAAYLEADFRGTTSGTVAVTSSSFGFRVRQAWIDHKWDKFQLSGGQMFSLLTPVRSEITPNPAEAMMSYVVDAQYLAGLVWDRSPGVRFVYRPNSVAAFGAAIENPEQQVGTVVKFPAALASVLGSQYNTGTAELRTPNLGPDLVFKGSFNFGPPGRRLHIDAGTVLRFFRSADPASIASHQHALGLGANINVGLDVTRNLHLVLNGFASSGGGRYVGGLVPDVVVRADGQISPVRAHSWVGGLEFAPTRRAMLFGYYSGVYAGRNLALDKDGSPIGFGYAGSNAARRLIDEWTAGWGHLIWSSESAGSIQFNTQYSYLRNLPWWAGAGPPRSKSHLVFGQIRYNLP